MGHNSKLTIFPFQVLFLIIAFKCGLLYKQKMVKSSLDIVFPLLNYGYKIIITTLENSVNSCLDVVL